MYGSIRTRLFHEVLATVSGRLTTSRVYRNVELGT
jgi:hypothetical protein